MSAGRESWADIDGVRGPDPVSAGAFPRSETLGTIRKSGEVLALFEQRADWGVSEVSRELGFAKSVAHSLLSSLTDIGLLRRVGHGRYELGYRLLSLNAARMRRDRLLDVAGRVMGAMSRKVGQPVLLCDVEGDDTVILLAEGGGDRVAAFDLTPGRRVPLNCTAAGKILIADLWPDRINMDSVVTTRMTPHSICAAEQWRSELARVRSVGIAYNRGERDERLCAVGAGVRGPDGVTLAALSIIVPETSFERGLNVFESCVRQGVRIISDQLRVQQSTGG